MSRIQRPLWGRSDLLFGGLLCLALAVPSAVQASPSTLLIERVQRLEKAVQVADNTAVLSLVAATPDNRGREELLALIADYHAAGTLEYVMQERFGGVVPTKWSLRDARIEIDDLKFEPESNRFRLNLRITLKEQDGPVHSRAVAGYMKLDDLRLVLPEGFLPVSKQESQLITDLLQYRAKLLNKTVEQVTHGKFQSRAEVARAIDADLKDSEPMRRFLASSSIDAFTRAVVEALPKALQK